MQLFPPFDSARFDQLRESRRVTWGRPVRAMGSTVSTNDLACAEIDRDTKTGIVFVADEQTGGRGRQGNRWDAPTGQCLLFSTMVRFPAHAQGPSALSLAVGLALRDVVVRRLPPGRDGDVKVKWPNDVTIFGRKIAGILVESRSGGRGLGVVIGVGLNVLLTEFPDDLPWATSLLSEGATDLDRESLLVDALGSIESRTAQYLTKGTRSIARDLAGHDALEGRWVTVGGRVGFARGISDSGALRIETAPGTLVDVHSGHVEWDPNELPTS